MITGRFSKIKIGLTIAAGIAIFIFFVVIVGTENNLFTGSYNLKMYVNDLEGLTNGSMVTLGGMKIGQVKKLEFASTSEDNGIMITINIQKEYKKIITDKSLATIKSLGMLGDKYVDITLGKPNEKVLEDGMQLKVEKSFSIEKSLKNLEDKVTVTLTNLDTALGDFKNITRKISRGEGTIGKLISSDGVYNNLYAVTDKFGRITDAIIQKRGTLGKTIYDNELYDNIQYATSNIKTITEDLKTGKGTIGKLMTSDTVYNNVKSISEKLDTIFVKMNGNSTVGNILNGDEMYKQFLSTIKEFNILMTDIRKNPKKYINISIF